MQLRVVAEQAVTLRRIRHILERLTAEPTQLGHKLLRLGRIDTNILLTMRDQEGRPQMIEPQHRRAGRIRGAVR